MTPEERAHAAAVGEFEQTPEPRRRLSWIRVLGVFVVIGAIAASLVGFRSASNHSVVATASTSFAPYVDVTATPQFGFEDPAASTSTNLVLGFVVSSPGSACQPSWGGAYSLSSAASGMDLDRRIARLRQRGGEVSVSFGGAANSELSIGCKDVTQLSAAYRSVIDRYSVNSIDLDIEGTTASAPDVATRRAIAINALQQSEKAAGHSLSVWVTLPVSPSGLTAEGKTVLNAMLAAHVELAGVNGMTMDYGQPLSSGQTMASLSEGALTALQQQLRDAYSAAGSSLSDGQAWQHIGATPMIGQNDTASERFELADAQQLLAFAQSHRLRRLSMWSVNRDQTCGPNYANVEIVSNNCSGVSQAPAAFTKIFSAFSNDGSLSGGSVQPSPTAGATTATPPAGSSNNSETGVDNPATSPYAIWNPAAAYPKNTKIVWHHNVYQAKWYTQGDTPDAPVATPSDTPWTLIGPVLPGEHPAPTPTLKAGTYPTWSSAKVYVGGDRVLFEGVGYQAKWWTQGDAPGAPVLAPSDTPWTLITSS
ncbi:chitinase [Jatrophihabitans sp. DSM 45814]